MEVSTLFFRDIQYSRTQKKTPEWSLCLCLKRVSFVRKRLNDAQKLCVRRTSHSTMLGSLVSPRDRTKSPDRSTTRAISRRGDTGEWSGCTQHLSLEGCGATLHSREEDGSEALDVTLPVPRSVQLNASVWPGGTSRSS